MTPAQRQRRIRYLHAKCQRLWDSTSLSPNGGYATPADADRERQRQAAARELHALKEKA